MDSLGFLRWPRSLVFLFCTLSSCSIAVASYQRSQCGGLFGLRPVDGWTNSQAGEQSIRRAWDRFENSHLHRFDPKRYRLTVRAADPGPDNVMPKITEESIVAFIKGQSGEGTFSGSLISETLPETYHYWGLVLVIPSVNIIATAPFDMGHVSLVGNSAAKHFERYRINTPDALIRETVRRVRNPTGEDFKREFEQDGLNSGSAKDQHNIYPTDFNELRFFGSRKGSNVQVIGLFIQSRKTEYLGYERTTQDIAKLKVIASKVGLPILVLPEIPRKSL